MTHKLKWSGYNKWPLHYSLHDLTGFSKLTEISNYGGKNWNDMFSEMNFSGENSLSGIALTTTDGGIYRFHMFNGIFFEIFSEFSDIFGIWRQNFNDLTEFLLIWQRQMFNDQKVLSLTRYFLRYFWFDRIFEMIRTINFSTLSFTSSCLLLDLNFDFWILTQLLLSFEKIRLVLRVHNLFTGCSCKARYVA